MGLSGGTVAASIALTATSVALVSPAQPLFVSGGALLTIKQTDRLHLYSQVS